MQEEEDGNPQSDNERRSTTKPSSVRTDIYQVVHGAYQAVVRLSIGSWRRKAKRGVMSFGLSLAVYRPSATLRESGWMMWGWGKSWGRR